MILRRSLLAAPAVLLLPRGLRAQVAQTGAGHATAFVSCNGLAVPAVPANVPSGGAWATTDLTVVANAQNAPDFTLTASSITVSSGATALGASAQYNIGNAGGAGPGSANPVRAIVYLRTLGLLATSWVLFQISDGTNTFGCYFNTFTYGSVGNPVTGGDGALVCKSATLVTNGYIKLDISGTFTGNHANVRVGLFLVDSNGGTTSAAGLAQNFWGAGAGATVPTTFDPATATMALSGGNLTATASASSQFAISTTSYTTGKKYCEVNWSAGAAIGPSTWFAALFPSSITGYPTGYVNAQSANWVVEGTTSPTASLGVPTGADPMAVAFDFTNGRAWVRGASGGSNPNWNNNPSADPVANVGGADISGALHGQPSAFAIDPDGSGQICTVNFGATNYVLGGTTTPPLTGYTNW